MSKVKERINRYFDAAFPIILYKVIEEAKAVELLKELVPERRIIEWSTSECKDTTIPDLDDYTLDNMLGILYEDASIELRNTLLIIKDSASFIDNPRVIGYLKRLAQMITDGEIEDCTIAIVGQNIKIPDELELYVSIVEDEPLTHEEIGKIIEQFCADYEIVADKQLQYILSNAFKGLCEYDIINILALAYANDGELTESDIDLILEHKRQIVQRTSVLEMVPLKESIHDIGGLNSLKEWITKKEKIFNNIEAAKEFGVDIPKGVLIAGVPGCGKSLSAKAIAHLFKAPLLRLDMGRIMGKYVGESEENMRKAIALSESIAPCVLWIDEIEKALSGVGGEGGNTDITNRLLGSFLTWLQEKKSQVFVVMTANKIDKLPPELIRKGRMDEIFFVDLPNQEERTKIFEIHINSRRPKDSASIHLDKLAKQTEGYSGADIEGVVKDAVETAFTNNRSSITTEDIETAISKSYPLKEIMKEQIEAMVKIYKEKKFKSAT